MRHLENKIQSGASLALKKILDTLGTLMVKGIHETTSLSKTHQKDCNSSGKGTQYQPAIHALPACWQKQTGPETRYAYPGMVSRRHRIR
jgi:hypothetical protein